MDSLTDLRDLTYEAVLESLESQESEAQVRTVAVTGEAKPGGTATLCTLRRLHHRLFMAERFDEAFSVKQAIQARYVPMDDADLALSDDLASLDDRLAQTAAVYDPAYDAWADHDRYPASMDVQQELTSDGPMDPRQRYGSTFRVPQVEPQAQGLVPDYVTDAMFHDRVAVRKAEANGDSPWRTKWRNPITGSVEPNARVVAWDTLDTLRDAEQPDRFAADVPLQVAEAFDNARTGFGYTGAAPLTWLHRTLRSKQIQGEPIALLERVGRPTRRQRALAHLRHLGRAHPPAMRRLDLRIDSSGVVGIESGFDRLNTVGRNTLLDELRGFRRMRNGRQLQLAPVRASQSPELPNHLMERGSWEPTNGIQTPSRARMPEVYAGPAKDARVASMRDRSDHQRVARRSAMVFSWMLSGYGLARSLAAHPPVIDCGFQTRTAD